MNITGQRLYPTGTDDQGAPCVDGKRRVRITGLGTAEHPFDAPELRTFVQKVLDVGPVWLHKEAKELLR